MNNAAGKTLQFRVNGVVPGAFVELFDGDVSIGAKTRTGSDDFVSITTSGPHVLPDGERSITAKQTLRDQPVHIWNTNTTANLASELSPALTIKVDSTPPAISGLSPADNATDVAPATNLIITFGENVQTGAWGNVVIRKSSDHSAVDSIRVGSLYVIVAGSQATITLHAPLAPYTEYYVEVDAGTFEDLAGNAFAGISGTTTWSFATGAGDTTPPTAHMEPSENRMVGSSSPEYITVVYDDDVAVRNTFNFQNLLVTAPSGLSLPVVFLGGYPYSNARMVWASYSVYPPNGTWQSADIGTYTVTLLPDQVTDTSGNAVPAGTLGTFTVLGGGLLGVFAGGYWYRDVNANQSWDSTDAAAVTPLSFRGAVPVAGDWNGDGRTELGAYANGQWWLDSNGNQLADSGDAVFQFGWRANFFYGSLGAMPVVGDWNGDRKDDVGVYNLGAWFRDVNGNCQWDCADQQAITFYGWSGAQPVVGNWTNPGHPLLAAGRRRSVAKAEADAILAHSETQPWLD